MLYCERCRARTLNVRAPKDPSLTPRCGDCHNALVDERDLDRWAKADNFVKALVRALPGEPVALSVLDFARRRDARGVRLAAAACKNRFGARKEVRIECDCILIVLAAL